MMLYNEHANATRVYEELGLDVRANVRADYETPRSLTGAMPCMQRSLPKSSTTQIDQIGAVHELYPTHNDRSSGTTMVLYGCITALGPATVPAG